MLDKNIWSERRGKSSDSVTRHLHLDQTPLNFAQMTAD